MSIFWKNRKEQPLPFRLGDTRAHRVQTVTARLLLPHGTGHLKTFESIPNKWTTTKKAHKIRMKTQEDEPMKKFPFKKPFLIGLQHVTSKTWRVGPLVFGKKPHFGHLSSSFSLFLYLPQPFLITHCMTARTFHSKWYMQRGKIASHLRHEQRQNRKCNEKFWRTKMIGTIEF